MGEAAAGYCDICSVTKGNTVLDIPCWENIRS
jgi:hypothetical protein